MPWKVSSMSEVRWAFVQEIVSLKRSVSVTCRKYGVSRKTGYKWLQRYREFPGEPLGDRSRRPHQSPQLGSATWTEDVLAIRDEYGWGAQKILAHLRNQAEASGTARELPCERTVGNILRRGGRIAPQPAVDRPPPQFFTRAHPHELWQCDFKSPVEVERRKVFPFTVLDDHSRYLMALRTCLDVTMKSAWQVLWETFGEYGLPEALLSDNAFGTQFTTLPTISWFESQLILLGIHPLHGQPYHPQTQGKVERLHGTLESEVWPYVCRDTVAQFDREINRWRTHVYNPLRPHEALGDRPPLTRFQLSPRRRPATVPEPAYPSGSTLRRVSQGGDVSWKGFRILVGAGLHRQPIRVEERDQEVALFFCWKQIRCLKYDQLRRGPLL